MDMTALGVSLLMIGAIMVLVEAHVPTLGVLGGPGVIALAVGALLAVMGLGGGLALGVLSALVLAGAAGGVMLLTVSKGLAVRRRMVRAGPESMIGHLGTVRSWVDRTGSVMVDGALWRACRSVLDDEDPAQLEAGDYGRGRPSRRPDRRRPPRRGMGADRVILAIVILLVIIAGARADDAGRLGQGAARVRTRRRVPPRTADGPARPGADPARADDRPDGADQPAHGHAHRAAAGDHHPRQHPGPRHRGHLLPRRRSRTKRSTRSRTSTTRRSRSPRRRCARCSAASTSTTCCPSASTLNESLQQVIDAQTEPWGIKVTTVEIKDVEIPERMQHAIARQAEAERERRAKIINAEGEAQAARGWPTPPTSSAATRPRSSSATCRRCARSAPPRTRRSCSRCRST